MRLLLGGGGSGGHVFPAIAVAEAMRGMLREELQLLLVGTAGGVEAAIAQEAGISFAAVSSRRVRGRHPLSQIWSTVTIVQGIGEALQTMHRFRPNAVLVTGGYVSVPVGVAAWLLRRPLVLFLPDIEPGWAARLLARLATRICTTDARSIDRLPVRKSLATGYPLRPVFKEIDRPMARAHFQLNGGPAVLITGAVQGARSLNRAVEAHLEAWLEAVQLIHVSGPDDEMRLHERRRALPPELQRRYHLFGYLGDELPMAMAACDLAVARAGASVLGELPAAGLPAVLVPLPAAGVHQRRNAEVLEQAGAAVILDDAKVERELLPTARALVQDPDRLAAMRHAARAKARSDAAERIAEVLWEVRR